MTFGLMAVQVDQLRMAKLKSLCEVMLVESVAEPMRAESLGWS